MFSLVAHSVGPLTPDNFWHHWTRDPALLFGLCLSAYLYTRGRMRIRHRAGWRDLAFWGGMALLAVSLLSPLDGLGETLLVAHMGQHLLLLILVPILFSISSPLLPLLWSLPASWRHTTSRWRVLRRFLTVILHPITACLLYWVVLWLWHMPALYQWALRDEAVHVGEHLSFLIAGMLFWWTIIHPRSPRLQGYGLGVLFIFASAMQGVVLGALMTFSKYPWYPSYGDQALAWGLTPLQDQQLAGLVMWIVPGILYVSAAAALVYHWLRALDSHYERRLHSSQGVVL